MKKIAWVFVFLIGLAMVVFIGQNTSPVQARFLWYSAEQPAILWLFLATAGGFILGMIAMLLVKSRSDSGACKEEKNSAEPKR